MTHTSLTERRAAVRLCCSPMLITLLVALAVSILLFVLLYSTLEILAQPENPLLPFYLSQLTSGQGKNLQRCLFIVLGFAWASWRAVRSIRRHDAVA